MVYANRENGGMSQGEIADKLEKGMNEKTYADLRNSGIKLINEMINTIKEDKTLPYREMDAPGTGKGKNTLAAYRDVLIRDEMGRRKMGEIKNFQSAISRMAEEIDKYENETLDKLKFFGSCRLMNAIKGWNKPNFESTRNECTLTVTKVKQNKTINDIYLYRSGGHNINEPYIDNRTGHASDVVTQREVIGENNEFILDYSQCDSVFLENFYQNTGLTHHLNTVVVTGKDRKKAESQEPDEKVNVEYFLNPYTFVVRIKDGGLQRKRLGEGDDQYVGFYDPNNKLLPIVKGLKITEKSGYDGGLSADIAIEDRNKRSEVLGTLGEVGDWEVSPENKPELKKYLDFFPENSELRNKLRKGISDKEHTGDFNYNRFVVATENRIRQIVDIAHNNDWFFQEPIIDTYDLASGMIGIRFYDKDGGEHLQTLWYPEGKNPSCSGLYDPKEKELGQTLYNYINGNTLGIGSYESDYEKYVENSIRSKFREAESLKPKWIITNNKITDPESDDLLKDKEEILWGLDRLKALFEYVIKNENGKKEFEICLHEIIEPGIKNVSEGINLSSREISHNITGPIMDVLNKDNKNYKSNFITQCGVILFDSEHNKGAHVNLDYHTYSDRDPETFDRELAFRALSKIYGYAANDVQSNELAAQKDEQGNRTFQVNNPNLNNCLKNIDNKFEFKDGDITVVDGILKKSDKIKSIDALYEAITTHKITELKLNQFGFYEKKATLISMDGPEIVYTMLRSMGIIPDEYEYKEPIYTRDERRGKVQTGHYRENKEIKNLCTNIYNALKAKKEAADNIKPPSPEDIKKQRKNELTVLRKKETDGTITDLEKDKLNKLKVYEDHPELAIDFAKKTIDQMKEMTLYSGINDVIYHELAPYYANKSGGTNNDLYNNIKGFGFFVVSDENAKTLEKIGQGILISAATRFLGGPVWEGIKNLTNIGAGGGWISKIKGWFNALKLSMDTKIGKFTSDIVANSIKDKGKEFIETIRKGDNPFTKLTSGWENNFLSNFKSQVGSAIFNSDAYQITRSDIRKRVDNKLSIPYSLVKDLSGAGINAAVKSSFLNITFGRKNADGNIVHDLGWDDKMVSNVTASIIGQFVNHAEKDWSKRQISEITNNINNGIYVFCWDKNNNLYVANKNNNKPPQDLTDPYVFNKLTGS